MLLSIITQAKQTAAAGFGLKTFRRTGGRDGNGYTAALTFKGKAVAFLTQDGSGGSTHLGWMASDKPGVPDARASLAAIRIEVEAASGWVDEGDIADGLVDWNDLLKEARRKTCFIVPSEEYHMLTIKQSPSPELRAYIGKKFPGAVILNDLV